MNDIQYPQNQHEVDVNRKRYIKALRKYKNQCFGDLFRHQPGGKELKCAVGVGAAEFFGLKTFAQYVEFQRQRDWEFSVYNEVAKMLGIESDDNYARVGDDPTVVTVDRLWKMNDRSEMLFADIADTLQGIWNVK